MNTIRIAMWTMTLVLVGATLAETEQSCAAGDQEAAVTARKSASWTDQCARLREQLRSLDCDVRSQRQEVAQLAESLEATGKAVCEREKLLSDWLDALSVGRQLLLSDACSIRIGCKTYTKAELACVLKQHLCEYQSAIRELQSLRSYLAERQHTYDAQTKRLSEMLAARNLAVATLKRHEAGPVAIKTSPVKSQRVSESTERKDISDVVAEVDRLLADAEQNKK